MRIKIGNNPLLLLLCTKPLFVIHIPEVLETSGRGVIAKVSVSLEALGTLPPAVAEPSFIHGLKSAVERWRERDYGEHGFAGVHDYLTITINDRVPQGSHCGEGGRSHTKHCEPGRRHGPSAHIRSDAVKDSLGGCYALVDVGESHGVSQGGRLTI